MAAPPAPEPEASPDSIEIVYVPRDGARPHRHHAVQVVVRAFREFAATPMLVMFGFAVLAGVSIAGDQAHLAGLDAVRRALSHVIGKQASTTTLQAIATGLITVTSITFSVLLLAVQQTASTLSPVVFDQFVRRRTNQVFLGFFVGLALYAYVVMAVVQDKTPPIIGAFIATVLTVISMLLLLALVYTSIDQMRPTNVVRQIHDRILDARRREGPTVCRTRRRCVSTAPVRVTFRSSVNGYVTGVDVDALSRSVEGCAEGEVRLAVTLGQYVSFGDDLAEVAAPRKVDVRAVEEAVLTAIVISRQRNLDHDATTGIDQLGNIAWTSGSSSKHNPEISRDAMYALRDLAGRLLERDPAAETAGGDDVVLPVVYPDNDLDRVFEVDRTTGDRRERLLRDLDALRPLVEEMPAAPVLTEAVGALPRR